jgi:hypothetical protein
MRKYRTYFEFILYLTRAERNSDNYVVHRATFLPPADCGGTAPFIWHLLPASKFYLHTHHYIFITSGPIQYFIVKKVFHYRSSTMIT